jgi:hypothetical protein
VPSEITTATESPTYSIAGSYLSDMRTIRAMYFQWRYLKLWGIIFVGYLAVVGLGTRNWQDFWPLALAPLFPFFVVLFLPILFELWRHRTPKAVRLLIDDDRVTWWIDEIETINQWEDLRSSTKQAQSDPNIWWLRPRNPSMKQFAILKRAFSATDQHAIQSLLEQKGLIPHSIEAGK